MKDDAPDPLAPSAEDPLLRQMLDAGRTELPNDAQLAEVARRLGPILGGPGGGPGGGGVAHPATVWPAAAKVALLAAAVAGTVWVGASLVQPASTRVTVVVASATTIPSVATPDPPPPPPLAEPVAIAPPPSATHMTPPRAVPPSGEDETRLLERAQDSLATDPALSLSLADQVSRLPGGLLRQEADVVAIAALVRLGRRSAAESRADSFRTAHPGSAHLRRIAVLLGHD